VTAEIIDFAVRRRSARPEVRNPVLALPAARRLLELPLEQRQAIADVLADLARDCRERAEKAWRTNKGPMAVYWKATGVYAGHLKRALRAGYELPAADRQETP
jgi:hypothetical protein